MQRNIRVNFYSTSVRRTPLVRRQFDIPLTLKCLGNLADVFKSQNKRKIFNRLLGKWEYLSWYTLYMIDMRHTIIIIIRSIELDNSYHIHGQRLLLHFDDAFTICILSSWIFQMKISQMEHPFMSTFNSNVMQVEWVLMIF